MKIDKLQNSGDYIKNETLGVNIIKKELDTECVSVNGIDVKIEIEKNN